MAYTPLTTQVAGGTASAAGWANVVKANFESMGPHLIGRKTADQASTIAVNDAELSVPVLANEIWHVRFVFQITGGGTGFTLAWAFPSGELAIGMQGLNSTGTTFSFTWIDTTSPSTAISCSGGHMNEAYGLIRVGGTAGNLQLRWGPLSGSATMKANSTVWGVKLA